MKVTSNNGKIFIDDIAIEETEAKELIKSLKTAIENIKEYKAEEHKADELYSLPPKVKKAANSFAIECLTHYNECGLNYDYYWDFRDVAQERIGSFENLNKKEIIALFKYLLSKNPKMDSPVSILASIMNELYPNELIVEIIKENVDLMAIEF